MNMLRIKTFLKTNKLVAKEINQKSKILSQRMASGFY